MGLLKIKLRDHQKEAKKAIQNSLKKGKNKMAIIMATGSGKTIVAIDMMKDYLTKNKRAGVLFVTHLEQIWSQTLQQIQCYLPAVSSAVYAGLKRESSAQITVASARTLCNDINEKKSVFNKKDFDLIIIDEFHHSGSDTFKTILEYFTPKILLGMSCLKERHDDKQFLHYFGNNVVYELDTVHAIDKKAIASLKYYPLFTKPDIKYPLAIGDKLYEESNQYGTLVIKGKDEKTVDKYFVDGCKTKKTNVYIDQWEKLGAGKPTIVFCRNIDHAKHTAKLFNKRGISAVAIHSIDENMSQEEMRQRTEGFKNGTYLVACTIDKWLEGADFPDAEVAVFMRPTKSWRVYMQSRGRVLRKTSSKIHAIILDCAGSYKYAKIWRLATIESIERLALLVGSSLPKNLHTMDNGELIELKRDLKEEFKKENEDIFIGKALGCKTKLKAVYDPGIIEVFTEELDDYFYWTGEKSLTAKLAIQLFKTKNLVKKDISKFCRERNLGKEYHQVLEKCL